MPNSDLKGHQIAEHPLVAKGVFSKDDQWNIILMRDDRGYILFLISGSQHGIIFINFEYVDGAQLKIGKIYLLVSFFFSGIGAIIINLKLRTDKNNQVNTYIIIGTTLSVPQSQFDHILQIETVLLFKILRNRPGIGINME